MTRAVPLRADAVTITVDGETIPARRGESIAAALAAAGSLVQSTGRDGSPRGLYCGMGVCHECLVTVDGVAGRRACMVPVADGMAIVRQAALPVAAGHVPVHAEAAAETAAPDVLVVGAGPAGIAAATVAAEAGPTVLVLDERPKPGGQYFKQPGADGAVPEALVDRQSRQGARRIEAAQRAGVTFRPGTLVWAAARDPEGGLEISAISGASALTVRPKMLVIATGAYERPSLFSGWTLPGVMTTGAAQTLLRSYGVLPGRRMVVAGNGPLNFQLAAEMLAGGAASITVVEAAPPPWRRARDGLAMALADPRLTLTGAKMLARLRQAGVPVHWESHLRRVEPGAGGMLRAFVGTAAGEGVPIDADAVLIGAGFVPSAELARLLGCACRPVTRGFVALEVERGDDGETSIPDVFVVGEAGRFGGAQIALAQGGLAGAAIATRLGRATLPPAGAGRALKRGRRFQTALWRAFAAPERDIGMAAEDVLVCRCECVTLGALRATIAEHQVRDVATLKRLTRAGMGRCQGRYCGAHLHAILGVKPAAESEFAAPQAPLRPVAIARMAAAKPEWRGHRRSELPSRPPVPAEPFAAPVACATAVIGAGVVGLATAYFLAVAGEDVVVLEQGVPNAGASGGNAGTLHAQLLSFDFDEAGPQKMTPALATLPLQKESILLWQDLERRLATSFEIKMTGGLMVAEDEADLVRLERKAAAERALGIDCAVIDAAALRDLEPAISARFVGAAHCTLEGKINPLLASQALADAARRRGARIHEGAAVTAIERRDGRFRLATSRGTVTAGRVVNAAGPHARAIGGLAGVDLPVFTAPLQMIVSEAVAPLVARVVAHARRHLTLKQAANGNLLIGGGWPAGLDPVHGHPRPSRDGLEGNLAVAMHVVPALAGVHVIRSWGALNIDIDGAPIIGEDPRLPGFFTAVGANGYTLGAVMGQILADLVTRGRTDHDIRPFSVARFASA